MNDYSTLFSRLVAKTAEGKLKWLKTGRAGKLVTMVKDKMLFCLLDFGPQLSSGRAVLLTVQDKYGEVLISVLSGSTIASAAYILADLNTVQPRQAIAEGIQLLESL